MLSPQEKITVFDDQSNYNVKHPLSNPWVLWYDGRSKKNTQQPWEDNLKNIITFDTVEDFWGVQNNITGPSQLSSGSNYHLFKNGIMPMWEDQGNKKGGKWLIPVARNKKYNLDEAWLTVALYCIGGLFGNLHDSICGAVVSPRAKGDRIAIWTKTTDKEVCMGIGKTIKSALNFDDVVLNFQGHYSDDESEAKELYVLK